MLAACPFPANHGTPGAIREMAEAVSERGHDVHIVTYHFGEDIPVKGPKVHRITPLTKESTIVVGPTSRRPLYDLQMVFKTWRVIREHQPQLLHAHGYEAELIAWLCGRMTGTPVLYSGHNTMADELPSYHFIRPQWLARALARFLDSFVPRTADRCLPHSANIEKFLHAKGLRDRTEPVISFGINMDDSNSASVWSVREKYKLGDGPVIVYAGVLDQFQRLDLLLEAMVRVVRRQPSARLLVVRSIPQAEHLATLCRQAEALGIGDRLAVTETLPLEGVREVLGVADVAVVPRPQAPGFPIKLLNYMAARLPCVLFASSASTGLVDRETVLLAPEDTSESLGRAIEHLLADADLRCQVAEKGHNFVRRHHDRRVIAEQVCAAYRRVIDPLSERNNSCDKS